MRRPKSIYLSLVSTFAEDELTEAFKGTAEIVAAVDDIQGYLARKRLPPPRTLQ